MSPLTLDPLGNIIRIRRIRAFVISRGLEHRHRPLEYRPITGCCDCHQISLDRPEIVGPLRRDSPYQPLHMIRRDLPRAPRASHHRQRPHRPRHMHQAGPALTATPTIPTQPCPRCFRPVVGPQAPPVPDPNTLRDHRIQHRPRPHQPHHQLPQPRVVQTIRTVRIHQTSQDPHQIASGPADRTLHPLATAPPTIRSSTSTRCSTGRYLPATITTRFINMSRSPATTNPTTTRPRIPETTAITIGRSASEVIHATHHGQEV